MELRSTRTAARSWPSWVVSLVAVLLLFICHSPVTAMDIHEIAIYTNVSHTYGVPEEPFPVVLEFYIRGNLDDVAGITVFPPPGSMVSQLDLPSYGDGSWGNDDIGPYRDLTSLQSDYATGDYLFEFYDGAGALLDSVTLDYTPTAPSEVPNITSPAHGADDFPFSSPMFTWDDLSSSGGIYLDLNIDEQVSEDRVYGQFGVSVTRTSWAPGNLAPATGYYFDLYLGTAIDGAIVDGRPTFPQRISSILSDAFTYKGGIVFIDGVSFRTSDCRITDAWVKVSEDGFWDSSQISVTPQAVFNDHLYLVSRKEGYCQVWRTTGRGAPPFDDWEQVNQDGFETNSTDCRLAVLGDYLYVGTGREDAPGQVLRTQGLDAPPFRWEPVCEDGFGHITPPDVNEEMVVLGFGPYLYAGTTNGMGGQVWRSRGEGGPPFTDWERVRDDGLADPEIHDEVWPESVFGDWLYFSTPNCAIWRTNGTDWEKVNLDGFGDPNNGDHCSPQPMGNFLLAGTENTEEGAQVWRTTGAGGPPFTDWEPVVVSGFGTLDNAEVSLGSSAGQLYAGTENLAIGAAVWRSRGPFTNWERISACGFGDAANTAARLLAFNGHLFAGTTNSNGGQLWRWTSCELALENNHPTKVHFAASFNLAVGLVSELREDGDFSRIACSGSFAESPSMDPLSDPPKGDGWYYLARGSDHCPSYGDASLDPDPRDELDLADPCP